MSVSEKTAEQPDYAYSYQVESLQNRMRQLETKIRLLISVLIDKKIVGEDFGKTLVSETKPDEVVDWFLKLQKEEGKNA